MQKNSRRQKNGLLAKLIFFSLDLRLKVISKVKVHQNWGKTESQSTIDSFGTNKEWPSFVSLKCIIWNPYHQKLLRTTIHLFEHVRKQIYDILNSSTKKCYFVHFGSSLSTRVLLRSFTNIFPCRTDSLMGIYFHTKSQNKATYGSPDIFN